LLATRGRRTDQHPPPTPQDLSASATNFKPRGYARASNTTSTRGHPTAQRPSPLQGLSTSTMKFQLSTYFGPLPGGTSIAQIDPAQSDYTYELIKRMSGMDLQEQERDPKQSRLRADAPIFVPGAYLHHALSVKQASEF